MLHVRLLLLLHVRLLLLLLHLDLLLLLHLDLLLLLQTLQLRLSPLVAHVVHVVHDLLLPLRRDLPLHEQLPLLFGSGRDQELYHLLGFVRRLELGLIRGWQASRTCHSLLGCNLMLLHPLYHRLAKVHLNRFYRHQQ